MAMQPFHWPPREVAQRPWFAPATFAEYIASRVQQSASGCLVWQGQRNANDYGTVCIPAVATDNGKRALLLAHKLSFYAASGVWVPSDEMVCHDCDTPSCVNMQHLYRGTQSTNQADRGRRKRGGYPKAKPWLRVASPAQAAEVRRLYLEWSTVDMRKNRSVAPQDSLTKIAKRHGLAKATVVRIAEGRAKESFRRPGIRGVFDAVLADINKGAYRRQPSRAGNAQSLSAIARQVGVSVPVAERILRVSDY